MDKDNKNTEVDNTDKKLHISDVMHRLNSISIREMLEEIKSDKYLWGGYSHGDTETKFQARKCEQVAMVLLVTSRVMMMEDKIEEIIDGSFETGITQKEARDLFYDHIRGLSNQYKGDSATSNIRFDFIPNLFKYVAGYIPNGA